jgi:hypothetical protein
MELHLYCNKAFFSDLKEHYRFSNALEPSFSSKHFIPLLNHCLFLLRSSISNPIRNSNPFFLSNNWIKETFLILLKASFWIRPIYSTESTIFSHELKPQVFISKQEVSADLVNFRICFLKKVVKSNLKLWLISH